MNICIFALVEFGVVLVFGGDVLESRRLIDLQFLHDLVLLLSIDRLDLLDLLLLLLAHLVRPLRTDHASRVDSARRGIRGEARFLGGGRSQRGAGFKFGRE